MTDPDPRRPPVRYSQALGREICARVAAGESLNGLAQSPGMPSRRTFREWRRRVPDFAAALAAAQATAQRSRLAGVLAAERARVAARADRHWRRLAEGARTRRCGLGSLYSPEMAEAICARVAAGQSVLSIGAEPDMPGAVTIHTWVREKPEFREMYAAAKEMAGDMLFDLAREIALEADETTVRADTLRVSTLRWQVAALAPRTYSLAAVSAAARPPDEAGEQPMQVILQTFEDPRGRALRYTLLDGTPVPSPFTPEEDAEVVRRNAEDFGGL